MARSRGGCVDACGSHSRRPLRPAWLSRLEFLLVIVVGPEQTGVRRRLAFRSRAPPPRAARLLGGRARISIPSIGDHKIIWELNRHQHWLQLGRASWLTGQSPLRTRASSTSWRAGSTRIRRSSASTGRACSRSAFERSRGRWAIHFLLAGSGAAASAGTCTWLGRHALIAIDRQLTHVEQHLSYYFSPNTHLTGEALALYVVGQALPGTRGKRTLGGYGPADPSAGDRSTDSRGRRACRALDALPALHARFLSSGAADRASRGRRGRGRAHSRDAATRLADFTRTIADDEGRLPLIGDDDGGMLWPITGRECNDVRDSLAVAAVALDRPDLAPWGIPGGSVLDCCSGGHAVCRARGPMGPHRTTRWLEIGADPSGSAIPHTRRHRLRRHA